VKTCARLNPELRSRALTATVEDGAINLHGKRAAVATQWAWSLQREAEVPPGAVTPRARQGNGGCRAVEENPVPMSKACDNYRIGQRQVRWHCVVGSCVDEMAPQPHACCKAGQASESGVLRLHDDHVHGSEFDAVCAVEAAGDAKNTASDAAAGVCGVHMSIVTAGADTEHIAVEGQRKGRQASTKARGQEWKGNERENSRWRIETPTVTTKQNKLK
jgi:hypothetical protein